MTYKLEKMFQQDDCAPDSLEYFQRRFQELVGVSLQDFKRDNTDISIDRSISYESDEWVVSLWADDPFWTLYKKVDEGVEG